ncbi:MAG: UDP-N-acetylglucosamine 2-epimerase [Massilibacteroides sp.]|nr:UDP-N-acetylglucosamine 2-epimerase [Massilibacteroides sp.]MDD3062267.1 UDP-N-acetylglucosamine 2-epimerase [Massilibacteroides sp.]MDD4113994.1 UDP-N-acetylglucosamine 2-epimerase [Massilibacteroides sp.]MDD4660040.1 UDP-N-acetylglucosamine 2-epimerase [Massilibacteroides sp.]
MKKICIITGSRAEYGLMSRLMKLIQLEKEFQMQIIVTNMHLSPEFGLTYKEIENDGFIIDKKIEMLLSSDTANATVKSVGLGIIGFADAYEDLKPDIILVLGDRYEILAAVSAALLYKIPVAHLYGGEITEGAYDNSIRHAITKMAHLHFTSTEEYKNRVIQMGEQPSTVYNVGALGCDNILKVLLLSKKEIEQSLNFKLDEKTLLVTFHPVTMENNSAEIQIQELLFALDEVKKVRIIFTMPNSDTNGRIITKKIRDFVERNSDRSILFSSLGMKRYLSTLKYIGGVVGNSSSGIIEVPSFHIPTINIGDRQKGRIAAKSVLNCPPEKREIINKLHLILEPKFKKQIKQVDNPYDKPGTAEEIIRILKQQKIQLIKEFYNIKDKT